MVAGLAAEQPEPWLVLPWAAGAEVAAGVGAAARAAAAAVGRTCVVGCGGGDGCVSQARQWRWW